MEIAVRDDWSWRVKAYAPVLLVVVGTSTVAGLAARVHDLFVKGLVWGLGCGVVGLFTARLETPNPLLRESDLDGSWWTKAALLPAFVIAVRALNSTDKEWMALENGFVSGLVFSAWVLTTSMANVKEPPVPS